MKKHLGIYLLVLSVIFSGCKDDEYDGLLNVDPYPANAVTFPESAIGGIPLMDDGAFIINQNSVANGSVVVKIQGPSGMQIKSVVAKVQRFRGVIASPNVSPTVPTEATLRAPSSFSRTAGTSLTAVEFTPASEVNYTIDLNALPAALTNATLGAVAAPSGGTPQYDVFRFFFTVTYTDNSTVLSNEVRVVVKG